MGNPRDLGISRRERKEKKNLLRPVDGQKKSTRRLITHLAAFIWVSINAAGDFRVRDSMFFIASLVQPSMVMLSRFVSCQITRNLPLFLSIFLLLVYFICPFFIPSLIILIPIDLLTRNQSTTLSLIKFEKRN